MARPILPHPPSDRYASPSGGEVRGPNAGGGQVAGGPPPGGVDATAGGLLAEIGAVLAALSTALVLVVLGGVLGLTTGLLFVAGLGGGLIGLLLAGSARPRRRLRGLAITLAVAAVLVGAVGGWLIARGEGGTLGLIEYLWALTGLLVPVEALVAGVAAAWGVQAGPIRG